MRKRRATRLPPGVVPARAAVIFNPVAGGGSIAIARSVSDELRDHGVDHVVQESERVWHAAVLAQDAVRVGQRLVIVVGGDGTANEAVNGIAAASATAEVDLGIVPVGRGNDLVKQLGAPMSRPRESVRRILAGTGRTIDIGRVGRRHFVNGLGIGIDGYVVLEARRSHCLTGTPHYVYALLRALRKYRTAEAEITVDGRTWLKRQVSMIAVTNGPCHGGGFWICPHAELDDGRLDIAVADAITPARLVVLAAKVMRGAHVGHRAVHFHTGREVRIELARPLPAHVDGEPLGRHVRRLRVSIAGRLRVLA